MNSDDYINSNGPVSPQHLKKHLRAFLRLINKQHKRNLVDEYSRGKKEGYDIKELREEVEELRAEGADKDAKLKQKELEIEETRLALARSDGVDLDEGDVFDDEDDEYGNYEEEIEDKIENEDEDEDEGEGVV
ncbi:hypothetical protein CGMCC3_g15254 [Colletotrichum fructicola]|uniref:Uncharacterized protein n=1 Tax=Colletotrichum fructicola (strain Nara gc5) TaxID=1213859 RepID=A0A7J6IJK3_COLFN|nr:uncharacterized protein CGMCC3_g15254 [Colletotrichum fructicola]KAE9568528.1 hypothetical protein CGMCC3_g15254 [Colletotrichum fructicola]KAF4476818.1 hypothetical protein CGGC5_v014939 [Colletotrichum fructicola Nara gc5]